MESPLSPFIIWPFVFHRELQLKRFKGKQLRQVRKMEMLEPIKEESEEIQGDIRLSEEEMEREVQQEMSQEKDREITEEGAAGADIKYQIQGTSEQDINQSLLALQVPTDPARVDQLKIQVNSNYIQFCCSLGPCQPVDGFPKNPQGLSFQSQWYAGNKWLEYSLEKDAMYCFSCHLFLTEDKFKARTAWRTCGVVNWRKAVEKIHKHSATETHMISMVSKRHAAFIEMQKLLYAGEKTWELKQLNDTCWACRENALKALQKAFSAVIQLLRKISNSNPPDPAAGDALMLFRRFNFEFMLCLEGANPVFQKTAVASAAFQHKDVDLAVSYTLVEGVLKRL
ncbi:hypothetical protein C0J45_23658 [Silurus meridionalis]|nr:hypothetical protein C0J45_23658 [Silurus meridionalis]